MSIADKMYSAAMYFHVAIIIVAIIVLAQSLLSDVREPAGGQTGEGASDCITYQAEDREAEEVLKIISSAEPIPYTDNMGFIINETTYTFPVTLSELCDTSEFSISNEKEQLEAQSESTLTIQSTKDNEHKYMVTVCNNTDESLSVSDCEILKISGTKNISSVSNISIGDTIKSINEYEEGTKETEQIDNGYTTHTWQKSICIQGDTIYYYQIAARCNNETDIIDSVSIGIEKASVIFK